MRIAQRVTNLPPYLFAELERKIAEKRAAGVDVISLGIGDPDLPSPAIVVEEAQRQVARPDTHQYPSNRGRPAFREAVADFYQRRFGVELDPDTEILPLLGGKEGVAHICWAMLDPGDVCLAADPGYPVYTSGAQLCGAEPVLMPLTAANAFQPDLDSIPAEVRRRANLLFCNYPNNPTGAVIEDDFYERLARYGLEHQVPIVHDNAYSEITFDGHVAASFLQAPGAKEAGLEMFSLSKAYNMTGWRVGAAVGNASMIHAPVEAEDEYRLGHVRRRADGGRAGAGRRHGGGTRDVRGVPPPPRPGDLGPARGRHRGHAAEGHHVHLGARSQRSQLGLVLRAGARAGRGRGLARDPRTVRTARATCGSR